jgi:tRNA pseudouridine synthase 10
MIDRTTLEVAEETLNKYSLCDACIGRLFRQVEKGSANKQKGKLIRNSLKHSEAVDAKDCWLCEGLLGEIEHFADLISQKLKDYEFETFLVGSKIDEDILQREEEVWGFTESETAEPIKMEINREVGKVLEKKTGKKVDFKNPDIVALIDTSFDVVKLQVKSVFIYGRYKKFVRGIPQTKWPCRVCKGRGCRSCNYSGKMYETSVEELISYKALELSKGSDESFHGGGREDIDVLMLGNGRPFVLEIKNPKVRKIDLNRLKNEINNYGVDKIEVCKLRYSDKDEVKRIKSAEFRKTYRVIFEGEKPISEEKLKEAARTLQGSIIRQFTPTRVANRRANKVREKKIYKCTVESVEGNLAGLKIETESGTYVKELISGDNEKTRPNLSELIGIPCICKELDVIEVKGE